MENELIESRSKMSFHLDGDSEIDATLLSRMISDMVEYTKIVAKEVNPDAYLKMNVTAFRNGSFQVDFSAVCQAAESIFAGIGVVATTAATVIGAVKGGIEVKKLLKGEKPKKVKTLPNNKIEIESKSGAKITVPSESKVVVFDVKADYFVSELSNCVREHNPNGGFTIADESGDLYCSAKDLQGMSSHTPIQETTTCQRIVVKADLLIRKPVLEGASKWGFEFGGKAIDASIDDEDFLTWFREERNGMVQRGDHLNVSMEILVDTNSQGMLIRGTEKYTIIKVNGRILHAVEQTEL